MKKHPPSLAILRARQLRKNATEAEKTLWRLLKENLPTARFRRQVPICHAIADFASHHHRLVIEIDGGQHCDEADRARTSAIESEGYRVVRFWNKEVLDNGFGCITKLANLLGPEHPHPASPSQQADKAAHPSPIKGEGV